MKHQTDFLLRVGALGAIILLTGLQPGFAAGTNANLKVHARTATVAAAPEGAVSSAPELPLSIFVVPQKVTEGKDPFFPNSSRVYGAGSSARATNAPSIMADLTLKGISGTVEQPLAIINTTTFTTGEINEVLLKKGRIKVQCLEINMVAGTVLLQVGGDRRQLALQR
jgi:hypothetical protein